MNLDSPPAVRNISALTSYLYAPPIAEIIVAMVPARVSACVIILCDGPNVFDKPVTQGSIKDVGVLLQFKELTHAGLNSIVI